MINRVTKRLRQALEGQGAKATAGLWRPAWQSNSSAVRPISWWRAL
jgi:hypothetical protein